MKFWYLSTKSGTEEKDLLMEKTARELGIQLTEQHIGDGVTDSSSSEMRELIRRMEMSRVDAVICRGRMERLLKEAGADRKIPVIPVQFLASSTISLLAHVKKNHPEEFSVPGASAAIFSHRHLLVNPDIVRELFHLELIHVVLREDSPEYLRQELIRAREAGATFVIGGPRVCREAAFLGMRSYYTENADEYESYYHTLELAVMFVENGRSQQEYRKTLEDMMNYSFEGMVLLNQEGRISFCNSMAREILEPESGDPTGKALWEMIPELDQKQIRTVVKDGETIYGSMFKIRNHAVLVSAIPYRRRGQIQGAILYLNQKERLEHLETQIKNEIYSRGLVAKYHFSDIKGNSQVMEECRYEAKQFAKHQANVLLFGESGTGKELFAQSIHNYSMRKDQPFVAVNCGALPMSLLESELFGYVGGAFTGASRQGKKGLIELADKGTIFLDEISEMDLQGQVRLLRVIEERVITKVGDDRVIPVDVRIIAASNKSLIKLVKEGKFREDLYYRLNVLTLRIPPLRSRGEDILLLADDFLARYGSLASKTLELTREARELLLSYSWPGNVRQLRNFCERLVVVSNRRKVDGEMIRRQLTDIYGDEEEPHTNLQEVSPPETAQERGLSEREQREREQLIQALNSCRGSRTEAAAALGIGRTSLWRKMKKYHLEERY